MLKLRYNKLDSQSPGQPQHLDILNSITKTSLEKVMDTEFPSDTKSIMSIYIYCIENSQLGIQRVVEKGKIKQQSHILNLLPNSAKSRGRLV